MRLIGCLACLAASSFVTPAAEILPNARFGLPKGATVMSTIVAAPPLGSPGDINDAAGPFRFGRGIGLDGTVGLIITTSSGSFLCSGAMIGSGAVLAAAHCFTNSSGVNDTSTVSVTAFPTAGGSLTLTAAGSDVYIPSAYDGSVISDYDLAIVRLSSGFGPGVDIYETFGAADLITTAPFTAVGFGMRGAGATGATLAAGSRRRGFNRFDFFNSPGVLISDFDNGLAANDASCLAVGVCDLGLGALEASTASGDSGGPVFLGGKIVAVTSFGARIGAFDVDSSLNSSFGEFAGFVSTQYHEAWIKSVLAIPEPASWLLSLAGLGAVAVLRRQSRS
jgi:hypothetical protein